MPTIRIETLGITNGNLDIAMYHIIPPGMYSPESNDQSRVPIGQTLTPSEIQDLKDGRLIETLRTIPIDEKTMAQLKTELARLWGDSTHSVHQKYRNDYSYIGHVWDGTWRTS